MIMKINQKCRCSILVTYRFTNQKALIRISDLQMSSNIKIVGELTVPVKINQGRDDKRRRHPPPRDRKEKYGIV